MTAPRLLPAATPRQLLRQKLWRTEDAIQALLRAEQRAGVDADLLARLTTSLEHELTCLEGAVEEVRHELQQLQRGGGAAR